ncbi:unnamed protein product [Rotaria sp. Silwood2]|nr:unnamed protein product [Rotaria sp. Silwood2]
MTIRLGEMEEWRLKNEKIPDSDDEAFVCSHEIQYEDVEDIDRKFHPIGLSVCTEEKQKDFEFIFKAIRDGLFKLDNSSTYKPDVLIADGSDAIRNAFNCIFESNKMVMCWAHVRIYLDKKLCLINDNNERHEVISDIEKLQICNSTHYFQLALELF